MRREVDVEPDAFFATNEASFFGGELATYPKFGCVHHEPLIPNECPGCWDSKCIHTCGK